MKSVIWITQRHRKVPLFDFSQLFEIGKSFSATMSWASKFICKTIKICTQLLIGKNEDFNICLFGLLYKMYKIYYTWGYFFLQVKFVDFGTFYHAFACQCHQRLPGVESEGHYTYCISFISREQSHCFQSCDRLSWNLWFPFCLQIILIPAFQCY